MNILFGLSIKDIFFSCHLLPVMLCGMVFIKCKIRTCKAKEAIIYLTEVFFWKY